MSHPIEAAILLLEGEVLSLAGDKSIKPLDPLWFVMQGKALGLTFLRQTLREAIHENAQAVEAYRKSAKVRDPEVVAP